MPSLGEICKAIVESHDDILIAAILDKEDVTDFYVRPGVPIPDEFRAGQMVLQTQLIISTIKQGQDYLGELSFTHIHMKMADVLFVPLGVNKVLVAMIKPQQISNDAVAQLIKEVERQSAKL